MSQATFVIGDVFDCLAALPDGSVDLILTSPPFLALRSYLPADHPDKAKEIGSEPDPASFIDTLLALTAEWRRVLAPHGSIAVELGDTYSGSGGAGGDYADDGMREGQEKFDGAAARNRGGRNGRASMVEKATGGHHMGGPGWPLAKSACLIPELYRVGLVYGRNPLTGEPSPAGQWRARNTVRWCRPNPPVGALGDKFRPATSDMVIACVSPKRWFDLDAVREHTGKTPHPRDVRHSGVKGDPNGQRDSLGPYAGNENPAGAPPLDWWEVSTEPYSGTVTTARREPCGPDDGGERTTSPDCPVHAGLPGQLPRALRDERAGSSSPRTPRTGDHPAPTLFDGSAPTDGTLDRSGSSPDPMTETTDLRCSPAATPRSTASRRTDPALATTPPGTPSAGMAASTDGTPASPESSGGHLGTQSSSSDEACPDGSEPESQPRSDRTSDPRPACTCSFSKVVSTQTTSHYATWPRKLLERPIKSMCPLRVCTVCGEPSRRIVGDYTLDAYRQSTRPQTVKAVALADKHGLTDKHIAAVRAFGTSDAGKAVALNDGAGKNTAEVKRLAGEAKDVLGGYFREFVMTTEAQPGATWTDCGHGDQWRPGVVLDPFAGSGTTLAVATGHGRTALGFDIDERNADLARDRVGPMFFTALTLAEWIDQREAS